MGRRVHQVKKKILANKQTAMASVQNPLNISADEVSMDFPLTAENAAEIRRLDGLYKEASSKMSPGNTYEWKPALKGDEDVAKVYFVLKGPTATQMTVMEGTKIIDSGTGMSFLEKNYRFLDCEPEINIRPVPWMRPPYIGAQLVAKDAVFRYSATSLA